MDNSYVIGSIVIFIILLLLGKWITEWWHQIEKRNRYMEAELKLLMHIAAKQGVDKDIVSEIMAIAGGNRPPKK
jgi:hypothetical protein